MVWSALRSKLSVSCKTFVLDAMRGCNVMPCFEPGRRLGFPFWVERILGACTLLFLSPSFSILSKRHTQEIPFAVVALLGVSLEDYHCLGLKFFALPWRFNTLRYLTRLFPFLS